jgi:hypothetical protein
MTDDIVARLREVPNGIGGYFYKTTQQAADEIERLRAGGCARDQKTTQYCAEAVTLQREVEQIREALRLEQEESAACAIDRRETQRERDEARRMVVNSLYKGAASKQSIARSLGWKNLFNENSTDMEGDVE